MSNDCDLYSGFRPGLRVQGRGIRTKSPKPCLFVESLVHHAAVMLGFIKIRDSSAPTSTAPSTTQALNLRAKA